MIITCSQCKTSFNLNEKILKLSGSKVRCSKCKNVFIAYPPEPIEEPEQPLQEEPQIAGFDVDTSTENDLEEIKENDALPDELDFAEDDIFFEMEKNTPAGLDAGDLDFSLKIDSDEAENEMVAADGLDELSELELPDSDDLFESDSDDFNDLDFSLESEGDGDTQEIEMVEDSGDIDLTELEKILDLDGMPDTKEPDPETGAGEFDLEPEGTIGAVADIGEQAEISAEELDLSDIEKMLDIDETETVADDESEDEELEFDLDLSDLEDDLEEDRISEPVDEMDDAGLELDLDFSLEEDDTDTGAISDMEVSGITEANGQSQPDFEIEGREDSADLAEMAEKEAELVKTFEMGRPERDAGGEDVEIVQEVEEEDERSDGLSSVPAKKGVSLPLVILLILALLAGGVYFVHIYTDIKIPYLSKMVTPEVQDSGGLKMITSGITSRFVENEHLGRFFVITGKIKNGYPEPRSFIEIKGKLYSKGKNLEKAQAVFCGNLLTNTELIKLDVEAIKKRLSNRLGDNRSNFEVAPGKILPFMVVFTELPEDLEEYTIEVIGSMAE